MSQVVTLPGEGKSADLLSPGPISRITRRRILTIVDVGVTYRHHTPYYNALSVCQQEPCSGGDGTDSLLCHIVSGMPTFLLQSVEKVGRPIEGWPNNILWMLFCCSLTDTCVRTVTEFFYGHGVPVELAYQLFEACRCTRTGIKDDVEALYNWFEKVDFGWGIHLGTYYNLRRRLCMWINGPRYPTSIFLEPVVPPPRLRFGFGFKNVSCPETYEMLNHIRHVKSILWKPFLPRLSMWLRLVSALVTTTMRLYGVRARIPALPPGYIVCQAH